MSAGYQRTEAEESACWEFLEESAFNAWRKHAQTYRSSRKPSGYTHSPINLVTRDGRNLFGYRVDDANTDHNGRALIVAHGNAILADHLTDELPYFAARGYTVFNFDHRGYGKSTGMSGIKAIIDDYKEIYAYVKSQGFQKIFAYGMSFGGIVLSNTMGQGIAYDALAIDSSPSTLPFFAFCPDRFDPLRNLPADSSNIMVMSGFKDTVITEAEVAAMGEKVRKGGGQWLQTGLRHPLMEHSRDKAFRFGKVVEFFNSF